MPILYLIAVVISLVSSANFIQAAEDASEVSFPDTNRAIKPCPQNEFFCEDADDYPVSHTPQTSVLEAANVGVFKDIPETPASLSARFQSGSQDLLQESRACDSRKSVVYPRKAKNTDGEYKFILNSPEYKQAVEIEQCIGEGQECRVDSDAPQAGLTVCRQKYTLYKMFTIDSKGKEILDSFSLPSACLCYYKDKPFGLRTASFSDSSPALPVCSNQDSRSTPPPTSSSAIIFTSAEKRRRRRQANRGGRIVFRDEAEAEGFQVPSQRRNKRHRQRQERQGRKDCDLNIGTFCETTQDYPADVVLAAVSNHPRLSPDLLSELLRAPCVQTSTAEIFTRRFNVNELPLCDGIRRTIQPKQALNLRNEWKYVVNIGNYTQSVEIEECDPTRATNSDIITTENGLSKSYGVCMYGGSEGNNPDFTRCRQIYSLHKLLSLSEKGQLEVDSFQLPVACDCYLRESFQLQFRAGTAEN